ncbi:hypothetical protein HYQ46_007019 [Verticillium longisporum]|nr:hypothetical protein HYQ46_007019 [Verticillium longisporum]
MGAGLPRLHGLHEGQHLVLPRLNAHRLRGCTAPLSTRSPAKTSLNSPSQNDRTGLEAAWRCNGLWWPYEDDEDDAHERVRSG